MMSTIKKYWLMGLVSVIMLATAAVVLVSKKNKATGSSEMLPVALRTIKVKDGWGYEVLVDQKVYIHQAFIPAVASYKPFVSEAEALLVGTQVINKMKQGHKATISPEEIRAAHIHY